MADFPKTKHDMLRAGYTSLYMRPCPRCKVKVERFRTRNGKEITMDIGATEHRIVQPHAQTCTGAKAAQPADIQTANYLLKFLQQRRGRAIVMVDAAGTRHWSVSNTANPETTKDSLISAAFEIQQHLQTQTGGQK